CTVDLRWVSWLLSFVFLAEDGIRVFHVTGVQTCALPILSRASISASQASGNFVPSDEKSLIPLSANGLWEAESTMPPSASRPREIGRASCRERGATAAGDRAERKYTDQDGRHKIASADRG